MPKVNLRVFANPFVGDHSGLDHEGRPNGHLQYEPNLRSGDPGLRWVGCVCVSTLLKRGEPASDSFHPYGESEDHDHVWEYATEPVSLPSSSYYIRAIQHHDLFPADAETHALVFGNRDGFVDPRVRLAQLAAERGAVPRLQGSKSVDPRLTPEQREKALADEWQAFVGPAVTDFNSAKKAREEALKASAQSTKTTAPKLGAKSES